MINYISWQKKHNISYAALVDLWELQEPFRSLSSEVGSNETPQQKAIILAGGKHGCLLMRNNVGVAFKENGAPVRFGLGNESKRINDKVTSSDLIGSTTVLVTPEMVGSYVGVFTAIEVKKQGWSFKGTPREIRQKNFHDIVKARFGIAQFATGPMDIWKS
jgi:hypothetical protein